MLLFHRTSQFKKHCYQQQISFPCPKFCHNAYPLIKYLLYIITRIHNPSFVTTANCDFMLLVNFLSFFLFQITLYPAQCLPPGHCLYSDFKTLISACLKLSTIITTNTEVKEKDGFNFRSATNPLKILRDISPCWTTTFHSRVAPVVKSYFVVF